jgi:RNA-directed DNA polymerase
MKTHKNLWERFISFENLYLASQKAKNRKRYKPAALEFNYELEANLHNLQSELAAGSYLPGEYRYFKIYEPKERDIYAAPYRDRVVHHAIVNIIEPLWERSFFFHSYACRVDKGMHRAIDVCQNYLRRNDYVLKCDIKKYFPSIDHEILKTILRSKIKDERFIGLIELMIDSAPEMESPFVIYPGDDLITLMERKKGIPIGNLTSQFFANLYLNELDSWMKHQKKASFFIRYMDDFLVFHNSKHYLSGLKSELHEFLPSLRLSLNIKKSQIFPAKNGVAFLGFHIQRNKRRLRKENIRRFVRRMKSHQTLYADDMMTLKEVQQSLHAWVGHAGHGDTKKLIGKLLYNYPLVKKKTNRLLNEPAVLCGAVAGTTTPTTCNRGTATTTTRPTTTTTTGFGVSILKSISGCYLYGVSGDNRVQTYSCRKRRKEIDIRQLVRDESCRLN